MNVRLSVCAMAVGLVIGMSSLACAAQYKMVDLGTYVKSMDLNENGQVVGIVRDIQNYNPHAFIWDSVNGIRELKGLEGMKCGAMGINDSGQVVGWLDVQNESHMFLWDEKNGLNDLGTFGVRNICPIGINNSGQIIGRYDTSDWLSVSFIWDQTNNQRHDIASTLSEDYVLTQINDQGQVLGKIYGQDEITPFLWDGECDLQTNPSLKGSNVSYYMNNNGQILVGNYSSNGISNHSVWDSNSNTITDLASLGCTMDTISLNDIGQFGGCVVDSQREQVNSAIWDGTNGLQILGTPDCYHSSCVKLINNSGMAVSESIYISGLAMEGSIIWVPQVPEPSSIFVLLGGVGGLALKRIRRN